jgi:small-conductance mechanosensitive channel/CRP-like cAMP-binding protein
VSAVGGWSSSWIVLEWAAVALLLALVLPYLLPPARRRRGRVVRIVLTLAVGLALAAAAVGAAGAMDAPGRVLHLSAILALLCGLIGLAGLVLFDLVLPPLRVDVPSLVRDVAQVAVAALAVLICLRLAGLDVLPLLTTSAVLTAVVGLALQATIANLFGGLSLQLDRTLEQGDWIDTGTHSGRIVEIGWRSTRLVTRDGDTLFLPNSQLVSGQVLNLSRPTGAHRVSLRLGLHRRHAPASVRPLLVDAVRDAPGVLAHPPPDCVVADLTDTAVVYAVRYWISEFERDAAIAGEVRQRLWYAARRAELAHPPPPTVIAKRPEEVEGPTAAPDEHGERLALLGGVDLLASLDDAERGRLAAAMRRLDFTAGEPIVRQGAPGDSLYLVHRGEVGVRVGVDGSSSDLATLRRGEMFGEMSLLTGEPRSATCVARTEVSCYVIDRAAFESLLASRPEIAEQLSATLAVRQSALEAQRRGLTTAARARLEAEQRSRLLGRIRDIFGP